MKRETLERHQLWVYLGAILAGLGIGLAFEDLAAGLEVLLWPALGLLLFATFTQVPLIHLPAAFRDGRFIGAVLTGNFLAIPLALWALLWLLPPDPAIRLGILLVLLVPCTDWFITFTHLGGGDTGRAIAVTPVNLLLQVALLPFYLWLFLGQGFAEILAAGPIAGVFVTLIVLPLLAAWGLERWVAARPGREAVTKGIGWFPVPLLALVVFLIAASQVHQVLGSVPVLSQVAGVFVVFLVFAALLGLAMTRLFALPAAQGRALIFSYGTRNSFVVLPFALALSPDWHTAVVVIVFQSLVELFGVLIYLRIVPRLFGSG